MEIKRFIIVFGRWHEAHTVNSVFYRRIRPLGIWTPFCWHLEAITSYSSTGRRQRKKNVNISKTGWFDT